MPAPRRDVRSERALACATSMIAIGDAARGAGWRKSSLVGTANTAKLLQISGVGPARLFDRRSGVHELAGSVKFPRPLLGASGRRAQQRTINEMARGMGLAGQIVRWAFGPAS